MTTAAPLALRRQMDRQERLIGLECAVAHWRLAARATADQVDSTRRHQRERTT